MENDALIFTDDETARPLLKKYARRVVTGRVFTFIYAGLGLIACIAFVLTYMTMQKYRMPGQQYEFSWAPAVAFAVITVLFVILGVASIRRPYVPMIISACITGLFLAANLFELASFSLYRSLPATFVSVGFQAVSVALLSRSAHFARKMMQLRTRQFNTA